MHQNPDLLSTRKLLKKVRAPAVEKHLLCGSQYTVENSERDGNTRPPNLPLEKSVCRSGSNS